MLEVNQDINVPESELEERFVRSPGPGGQHVNKTATAVQLRFDVAGSSALPERVRERLPRVAGRRINTDGVLVIEARRFRSQAQNREDARRRLAHLIAKAAEPPPKPRKPTKPSKAAKRRRIEAKRKRGQLKRLRGKGPPQE